MKKVGPRKRLSDLLSLVSKDIKASGYQDAKAFMVAIAQFR
jgi:hypothetical protein